MKPQVEAWLRQARDDLAMARLADEARFHTQACYHASQAAEKALKGGADWARPGAAANPCPGAPGGEPEGGWCGGGTPEGAAVAGAEWDDQQLPGEAASVISRVVAGAGKEKTWARENLSR